MSVPPSPIDPADPTGDKKRSSRACDQCRKTKSKCRKPADPTRPCSNCAVLGTTCTFQGPSYKRGPPKGYINAIEQRLHQVEAIFGVLVSARDERSQSVIEDLRQDPMAKEIISRVEAGPYGSDRQTPSTDMSDKMDPRGSRDSRLDRELVSSSYDVLPAPTPEWTKKLTSIVERRYSGASSQGSPGFENKVQYEDTVNDIVEKSEDEEAIGKLSVDEKDEIRYHADSSGMPLLDKLTDNPSARNASGIWRLPMARTWPYAPLNLAQVYDNVDDIDVPLPSQNHQDLLIQLYFTYVHPNLPIIHKPTFMRQYQESKFTSSSHHLSAIPKILLYAVFTAASRFNPNEMPLPRDGEMWEAGCDYLASTRRILNAVLHQSSVPTCQALILLSYREFGLGSFEQSYIFMGMALRMAVDLGLHRAADQWQRFGVSLFTPDQKQERKQVWWGIQISDKIISCFLGRPMMITERFYDTEPPQDRSPDPPYEMMEEEVEIWEPHPIVSIASPRMQMMSHTLSSFKALSTISLIIERIIEKLYIIRPKSWDKRHKWLNRLSQELQDWSSALPAHLHYNMETRRPAPLHVIMLHIQHSEALILLHRRFIPRNKEDETTSRHGIDTLAEFQLCQQAAEKITTLSLRLGELYTLKACPPFLPSLLLSAGIIHIAALALDRDARQAEIMLENTLSCLKEMEIVWPSAVRNWELLNGAKIRFHGNVPGSSRSEVNENLPNVPAAFGGESEKDLNMRIMAHLLGLKFPGVEAPPTDVEGWMSETLDFQGAEGAQLGPSVQQGLQGPANMQGAYVGQGMYQRLPESFYREGGPAFAGYDFQSFTNPDSQF